MSSPQLLVLLSPCLFLPFLLQTATSSWPMHRCRRAFPSSTALMASVSLRASPGARSCRRAAPVSSCSGQRPAKASSSALMTPWRSARSLRMRSCSTKRQVSQFCLFNSCHLCSFHLSFHFAAFFVLTPGHLTIKHRLCAFLHHLPIKCWNQGK